MQCDFLSARADEAAALQGSTWRPAEGSSFDRSTCNQGRSWRVGRVFTIWLPQRSRCSKAICLLDARYHFFLTFTVFSIDAISACGTFFPLAPSIFLLLPATPYFSYQWTGLRHRGMYLTRCLAFLSQHRWLQWHEPMRVHFSRELYFPSFYIHIIK
jgi:hypothetical protein